MSATKTPDRITSPRKRDRTEYNRAYYAKLKASPAAYERKLEKCRIYQAQKRNRERENDMSETAYVKSLITREELMTALRKMTVDNERFDHECWAIRDAETFVIIARMICEGYANREAEVECGL